MIPGFRGVPILILCLVMGAAQCTAWTLQEYLRVGDMLSLLQDEIRMQRLDKRQLKAYADEQRQQASKQSK